MADAGRHARILLRFSAVRLGALVRRPRIEIWLPALLTAAVAIGLLHLAADAAGEAVLDPAGASMVGFLVAAPLAFFGYGILYRARDGGLLLQTGVAPPAIFAERAVRFIALSAAVLLAALVPFLLGRGDLGRAALVAGAAALFSAPASLLAYAAAADMMATGRGGVLAAGLRDRELAAAAPILYAPLVPLFVGIAGAMVAAWRPGATLFVATITAAALVALAGALFARSLPHALAATGEMRYEAPPSTGAALVRHGGLSGLLPARVAAVRARDVLVMERRYRWAVRLAWPIVIGGMLAIARWGGDPAVRGWVVAAAGGLIVLQGVALIGVGWREGRGGRWFDRVVGVGVPARYVGRWAAGVSVALWTAIPIAIGWALWAPVGGAVWWLAAAAAVPAAAAAISLAASGVAR